MPLTRPGWWRWLVVAAGVAVLASLPGLVAALPAQTPSMSPAEVAARVARSADVAYQGFALSSGTAGLPSLPQLADVVALLNGDTQLRVYYTDPGRWRVDQLGVGTERDLYQEPGAQTLWDFGANQVTLLLGSSTPRLPRGADLVPPDLGRRLLGAATSAATPPTLTSVPARRVAGRAAVGLRITPTEPGTRIGQVDLWADPGTGLPLQVEVTAVGAGSPVLVSRFLDLSLGAPDPAVLTPPAGPPGAGYSVTSTSDVVSAFSSLRLGPLPPTLGGSARRVDSPASTVGVGAYGTGFTQFLVLPVPRRIGFDAFDQAIKAGGRRLTLPRGEGVVLSTALITLLVMDSDPARRTYILIGLVDPGRLEPAATELSTFTERRLVGPGRLEPAATELSTFTERRS